ncbi:MAG TPA: hypothetical protein VJS44_22270 [Pyrinomonadaceae bacterium]|nr:hypothetical protein [Pyrinomonadaceae bacterium]
MHNYCAAFYDPNNPDTDRYIYAPVSTPACVKKDSNGNIVAYQYFPPGDVLDGCDDLRAKDRSWNLNACYCCCGCFAYGTMVAVASGSFKAIEQIAKGDEVLAGTPSAQDGGDTKITWTPTEVTLSQGVAGGDNPVMVYLAFGEDEKTGDIVCSCDQVFILASGRIITAEKLQVGDQLVDKDGNPVTLRTVAIGSYKGGVHHIATKSPENLSLDGHLLLTSGVVVGDYYLQLHFEQLPKDWKHEEIDARPELGTPAYDEKHSALNASARVLFGERPELGTNRIQVQNGVFHVYTSEPAYLGMDWCSLLTPDQAVDILEKGTQSPLSNPVPKSMVSHLFHIFSGFYPDFVFYLDWYQMEPNVYAITTFDRKVIVVTGGLARMDGFGYEGMAMAIAHGIARFSGTEPLGEHAHTGTGVADYYAFAMISRTIWYAPYWMDYVSPAYQQMKALFGQISADNAKGNPNDVVNEPSVAGRLKAMQSGAGGGGLPEEVGGPPLPRIALQSVDATTEQVTLTLSLAPSASEATIVDNYVITPDATISSATQDSNKDFIIHLATQLEQGKTYSVTIRNLHSLVGSKVDPEHQTLEFTVD